ncbi:uncharacterized protein LOC133788227 [Humulus lupulus]|uniref:uncharacterized protein LOC133788227 n=1 Tax=Humulus lupulus TaxID=3486 RepID=UPI002B407119|nr:uncharacterized protein LOC133788227 [Humulus lupulus]
MDVSRWILEFLIRSPDNDRLAKRALSVMPIPNHDLRLKKIVLLRTIECEVSDALVTESILQNLELVEELDSRHEEGAAIAMVDSMKAAYCAVALECTVKFLVSGGGKPGEKYLNALDRIWRGRVRQLENSGKSNLLTVDLKRCWDEVEKAIWDDGVCKKLLGMNTRNEAVRLVLEYLKEAWTLMGPSFVEWAAKLTAEQRGLVRSGDGGVGSRVVESSENEPEVGNEEVDRVAEMREPVAAKLASPGGRLSVSGMLELANELRAQKDVREPGNDQVCDKDVDFAVTLPDFRPSTVVKEIQREKVVTRNKQVAFNKRRRGPVRISEVEDLHTNESEKCNSIPTPEVNRVRETLKSSTQELRALVKDPLPEALRAAEAVASDLATKNVGHEHPVESQKETEASAATNPSVEQSTKHVQSSDANLSKPSCSHQDNVPQPSLMARNSTAHTYEWDDSIDDDSNTPVKRSKLHLPSPKIKVVSPLKKYAPTKFLKRRKVKRWSLLEEDTLRDGVNKYGRGNWKLILNSYRDIFEERTEVDLKDKWRNMTR